MKKFLKNSEIQLINGGYLTTKEGESPINNENFVNAQKHAEYIITFAKLAKGKDFKGKKADSLAELQEEVAKALSAKAKVFVSGPAKPEKSLTEQLAEEAMSFIKFEKDTTKVNKINNFLQKFTVISEFEEFGLFFEDGIVKLNNIYTMKEIVAAVEECIDLLQ